MKLSILLTFYNQKEYVDSVLNSILSQKINYKYEILVGDDGSTDGTKDKVLEYVSKYPDIINLYVMKRDMNKKYEAGIRASKNRLNLLKHVRGEYFTFFDGDDYICDDKRFQKEIDILENPENIDCIACAHNMFLEYYRNGRAIKREYVIDASVKEQKFDIKSYWEKYYFSAATIVCRSSVISKLSYRKIKLFFNDNIMTFSMLQYGKLYYLPDAMFVYRQTGDGIWTGQSMDISMLRNSFGYDIANKINPKLRMITLVRFFNDLSYLYNNRHNLYSKKTKPYYKFAVKYELKESCKWILYDRSNILKKLYLNVEYAIRYLFVNTYKILKGI